MKKRLSLLLIGIGCMTLVACSSRAGMSTTTIENPVVNVAEETAITSTNVENNETVVETGLPDLTIRLGDDGAAYTLQLEDNDTAAAIARHVGQADWRLPIYDYDNFEHADVMQYYDIPSRFEIPSSPESMTSQNIGDVYYSAPNRIILFYQDGEVTGQYTKVGSLTTTDGLAEAVANNPVLQGWGNKIVNITRAR